MSENYTDKARAALTIAERAAARDAGGHLGTEHLLLGVLSAKESVAELALSAMGVDIDLMRLRVGKVVDAEEALPTSVSAEHGTDVAAALGYAKAEAEASEHFLIGTQHLLLGLLREGKGRAAVVLREAGVDLVSVRQKIALVLNLYASDPSPSTTSDDPHIDDPLLARARAELSEVRFAKQRAISINDNDAAIRLRNREKEILRLIEELRVR